jgi:hypothetical protein
MRLNWLFRAAVVVAALAPGLLGLQVALGTAASADTVPAVTSLSPAAGPTSGGTSVEINGTGFTGAVQVTFGGASVPFTVVSDSEITTTSPPGSSLVSVIVFTSTAESALSFHDGFTYANAPTITELFPSTGPTAGGTAVSMTGSGFTGATSVTFGGVAASNLTVVSDNQLTMIAPAGSAGPATVTVTSPLGTASTTAANQYTYADTPVVSGISPSSGPNGGGDSVTITGSSLTGVTAVSFGTAAATNVIVESDSAVVATAPAHADGTVDVTVTNPAGTSAAVTADQYTYAAAAPTVTAVSPATGPPGGGTTVTITGTGFSDATGVSFGSTAAAAVGLSSATSITAVTPAGSGTVDVTVTSPDGTSAASAADQFSYGSAPTATQLLPSSGPTGGGPQVTVDGTGFVAGQTSVTIGGTVIPPASVTVQNANVLTFFLPAGAAGLVSVTVTAPGGTSDPVPGGFRYQPPLPPPSPVVTALSPSSGTTAGGTSVTITGTGFTGVAGVSFGSAAAASFRVNSSTSITAVTNSTINGTVTATSPDTITYCGSTEDGTLSISGATGAVTLGDGGSCAADTIPSRISITGATGSVTVNGLQENGTLTLSGDTGGITLSASSVNGAVHVENNAGPSVTVAGNTVTGSLYCTGNNPAPTDNGSINTVSGTATDQCAAIAER